jgi:hypothetical protein
MDRSGEPSNYAARNEDRVNYESALKEMREKEIELCRRTEMLENMMRTLTNNFATSTPTEAATGHNLTFNYPSNPFQIAGNSKSYLRDALELVPKYDGHNIPVWQFARACKRAKESIPLVDEAHFVRMLRNKLSNHAYLAVEDEMHTTVEKFIDCLKRTFGSGRSSNYYRGQLSMAYKRQNEHILDYIGRIKDLRTAIIEGDQTNLDRSLNEPELTSIDSFALEAFYEGLPREYRIELRAEGYNDFSDACAKILQINRRLEREENRNKSNRNYRENSAPTRPQRDNFNNSPNASSNSSTNREQKICSFCKRIGHLMHECRKRQYRDEYSNNNNNNSNNNSNSNNNNYNRNNNQNYSRNNNYTNNSNNYSNNHSNNNYNRNNNSNNYENNPSNVNYRNSNYTNNIPSQNSGNRSQVSNSGATRGQNKALSANFMESNPGPSTSSEETMEEYHQSNSNPLHLEDQ